MLCLKSPSMQVRNAASVLPEPVGAGNQYVLLDCIAGQLVTRMFVGALKRR